MGGNRLSPNNFNHLNLHSVTSAQFLLTITTTQVKKGHKNNGNVLLMKKVQKKYEKQCTEIACCNKGLEGVSTHLED